MTDEKWTVYGKKADFLGLSKKYGIDKVTARILINRGVEEEEFNDFLHPSLKNLYSPNLLMDLTGGTDLTKRYIDEGRHIRIIGDYDCDGINSTYILASAIESLGGNVSYDIPDRIIDGYGLNERLVDEALSDKVDLIITCDNGIAAYDAIKKAIDSGIKVIVTDHHEVPFEEDENGVRREILPPADFVINPHREGDKYPFKSICGAVVAWKFVTDLFDKYNIKEKSMDYLENAAFATECDVMPLFDENRIILSEGLKAMEHTKNPGLRALLNEAGISGRKLRAYDLGFILGPCFNATGRIDTAKKAISLLFENDKEKAEIIAKEIHLMNEERKSMTESGKKKAEEMLSDIDIEKNPVIILYIPGLHESLCGLVAGKIKEEYYHPTFVLTDGEDGLKGSGRSIENYSMFEKMSEVKELFTKYGGHPMAAGLTIPKENLEEFIKRMNENASLSKYDLQKKIKIDVPMPLAYLYSHTNVIDEIECLAPFGNGNETPLFAEKDVKVKRIFTIGKTERKFFKILFAIGNNQTVEGLYFGDSEKFKEYYINKFSEAEWNNALTNKPNAIFMTIAYQPEWNEYNGKKTLEVKISHFK